MNEDIFYRPPVTSAECLISTENHPDSGILLNYNDDVYSQGYGQIKEAFRALTKDDILQIYISDRDIGSSSDDNDIEYNLYVFVLRYQKNLHFAPYIKKEFKFSKNIPAGI